MQGGAVYRARSPLLFKRLKARLCRNSSARQFPFPKPVGDYPCAASTSLEFRPGRCDVGTPQEEEKQRRRRSLPANSLAKKNMKHLPTCLCFGLSPAQKKAVQWCAAQSLRVVAQSSSCPLLPAFNRIRLPVCVAVLVKGGSAPKPVPGCKGGGTCEGSRRTREGGAFCRFGAR